MNQYETVFILTPVLSDDQVKEAATQVKDLIMSSGGEVVSEENWGLRQLAYPIQKKKTGFYCLLEFKSEPEFIQKMETELKRDEQFIRFATVKLDKHAVAYNEKRRQKIAEKKED